jgi:hypothetical protein
MVSSVNKEHHSFFVFPMQIILACNKPKTLPVRALLEKGPKWPNPVARLPSPHGFIAFFGKLAHFEDNVGHVQEDLRSQAVVSLDSIIYLCTIYTSNSVPMALPPPSHPHDADTVALKSHILKISCSNTLSSSSKEEDHTCCLNTHAGAASRQEQEDCGNKD